MKAVLTRAELHLLGLGVRDPADIDVRAIANDVGASVRLKKLTNCEARIIGTADRAIISVSEDSSPQRRRYSIGHELGHWELHRGRQFECRARDIDNAENGPLDPERQADAYAADLLMPWYLFKPLVSQSRSVDLALLEGMCERFDTSLPATAIRIAEANVEPMMVVCYDSAGRRRWFCRSKDVPERWFPVGTVDADTYAYDVIAGKKERTHMSAVGADAWFDESGIADYELREQSLRLADSSVLVILRITEEEMQLDHGRAAHASWRRG